MSLFNWVVNTEYLLNMSLSLNNYVNLGKLIKLHEL